MDEYQAYIASCKAPKSQAKIMNIVKWIIAGLRKGFSTPELATKLNEKGVMTIQGKQWTYNALQMQLLKMSRLDNDSSLAWALSSLLCRGAVSEHDLELLKTRTRPASQLDLHDSFKSL